jgi:hypothetical protein
MKKSFALLAGALPLAIVLSGCAQIEETVGNITGNQSHSRSLTVNGKVDTSDGSYSTVKASDEFRNNIVNSGISPTGSQQWPINNPETGEKMEIHPAHIRGNIITYFFDEFIDSSALEGGAPALDAFKAEKLSSKAFSAAPFTKEWLDGKHGESHPALTAEFIAKDGGFKPIHDGKPRMKDANISFGEITWTQNDDGHIIKIASDWSVDYRVTEETVAEMMKAQNKLSDADVQQYLTDDVKDGRGENILKVTGTADWYVLPHAGGLDLNTAPIYLISTQFNRTFAPFVKPEFHTPAPTAPAAP